MISISTATDQFTWDKFLESQRFSPFLQSWTMGSVYAATKQEAVRLEIKQNDELIGICFAHVVPARRGRHLSIPYGPVLKRGVSEKEVLDALIPELKRIAKDTHCTFIRMSPFWPKGTPLPSGLSASPLHLLGEYVWHLPLTTPNTWLEEGEDYTPRSEEELLKDMRKNTRNLISRAKRDGVEVHASDDPLKDLDQFIELHEETRKRHSFTPYSNTFFRAQVEEFSKQHACTLYLATHEGNTVAASIHMHMGGETSYHHGASTHRFGKVPASYLLQWTAITDALKRGDHTYSFWGIAPEGAKNHPFSGVTLFKRGFGGELLTLMHCQDIPVSPSYYLTKGFECLRKWKRGF